MAIDAKKVLVGAPDQSATTGAVNIAPIGTALPTDATTALGNAFAKCGYVSEDGMTISQNYSTVNIKDWSRATVRTLLDEFTGEITFKFIQTGYEELSAIFGAENVEQTAATSSHGEQLAVQIGAHLADPACYAFNMKDGDAKVRVVVPNAQAVPDGDLSFVADEAITWGCKLTCNADASGQSIYIYTDDGVVSA